MPSKIPLVKLNLDVGHGGTYMDKQGGKFGKAAVNFFNWQMKGDAAAGALFLKPEASALTADGWKIVAKNWNSTSLKSFSPSVKSRRSISGGRR
jgi:hypothetical protein